MTCVTVVFIVGALVFTLEYVTAPYKLSYHYDKVLIQEPITQVLLLIWLPCRPCICADDTAFLFSSEDNVRPCLSRQFFTGSCHPWFEDFVGQDKISVTGSIDDFHT